jgi:hypothetical protein
MIVSDINNAIHIDGTKCMTKEELFDTFFSILNFPDYFGYNWDSFEEIINDLNLDKDNIILFNAQLILQEDEEGFEIFSNILHQTNSEQSYTFHYLAAY